MEAVLLAFGPVFVAGLGHTRMAVTIAPAAREGVVATRVGSVAGFIAARPVGILLGRTRRGRVAERALRYRSALAFPAFGVAFLAWAIGALQ